MLVRHNVDVPTKVVHMSKRAFTLIEMLVAVSIISLLSTAALFSFRASPEKAKVVTAQAQIDKMTTALIAYRVDTGVWPPGYRPVGAPANNPLIVNPGVAGWRGPYLNAFPEAHPWKGANGFGISPTGRMYIFLDDDRPLMDYTDNRGAISRESLILLDQALDDGSLSTGNVVGNHEEVPYFSAAGELVIYVDH